MRRTIKILASLVGILLILLILAIVILPHIIDFNEHKEQVEAGIYRATGYEVKIEGDIELSFVPWLGISMGKASVANPRGFEPENLASVQELQARLKILPLFLGQLQMERIVLHGLELDLIKDKEGRPNWLPADPEQASGSHMVQAQEPAPQRDRPRQFAIPALDIAGLEVAEANISYQDLATEQYMQLTSLNLVTDRITQDEPFSLNADLSMQVRSPALQGSFRIDTDAILSSQNGQVLLTGLVLDLDLDGDPLPEPVKEGRFSGDIVYDYNQQSLDVSDLSVEALDAYLKGHVRILELDNTPRVVFEIEGENVDLDRLMNEGAVPEMNNPDRKNPAESALQNKSGENIDLSFLKDYFLEGKILLRSLTAHRASIDELSAELVSGNGQMNISSIQAKLYQGNLEGKAELRDVRGEAHLTLEYVLEDVQIGPLLRDAADKDFMTGRAEMDSNLRTFGTDADALLKNLFGKTRIEILEGTIREIDLEEKIREVFALASGQQRSDVETNGETEFSSLKANFDIASGVAVSRDLTLTSPAVQVQGEIRLDLPQSHMDSRSRVFLDGTLKEEISARYTLPDAGIPLRIHGPFDNVQVTLDVESLIEYLFREEGEGLLKQLMDQIAPRKRDSEEQKEDGARDFLRRIMPR